MIENRKIDLRVGGKKSEKPATMQWKAEWMIRNHSFTASILEIMKMSQNSDVVKINLIGSPGTGKTTLAKAIGHLGHKIGLKRFNTPYVVKLFDKENLLNFEETLKDLEPTNHILIFDDVSFLGAHASKQQIEIVKQAESEIRHLEGGQDIKIIEIKNFHYTLGVDKVLRQNDFSYFTTVGSSELENMQKITGTKYTPMLLQFQKIRKECMIKDRFTFKLAKHGKPFVYSYRNPFIPLLFHNGHTLRFVVSPSREWIDPICTICTHSKETKMKGYANTAEFAQDINFKFGVGVARNAIRIILQRNGMNVYPKRVRQCMEYIEKRFENKIYNLPDLVEHYKFDTRKTRLDEKTPEEEDIGPEDNNE